MKSSFLPVVLAGLVGTLGGALGTYFLIQAESPTSESAERQPLYWVAPMDANYRRDKPGKSPMGMDLVPVYEEANTGDAPGTVRISPTVVNNLGVRTGLVERKSLHTEITTVGYVQYDENKLIHIHPRISGWVEKLYVKASGDPVKQGAPMYSLYSPELVNAQEELVLALKRGNPEMIRATEARLKALQFDKTLIRNLRNSREVQQTVTFFAPQTGVVDHLQIREGYYVEPGTTLFSIGALDKVWVEAEVFERQASLVKVNNPVTMTLDYLPGQVWQGQVDYIYPTLNSSTRTARLRLSFDNPVGALKPNMFAQVVIHADSAERLLVIPREALIRTGRQDRVVLAQGEGRFKSIAVQVGRGDQQLAEITEGLEEGDEIVLSAQFLLDSESSKNSDFMRMSTVVTSNEQPLSVTVLGEILQRYPQQRKVHASHEPIPQWNWPEMLMDFTVAENVDIEALKPGTLLHMEISKGDDGNYQIIGTHIMEHSDTGGEMRHD